MNSRAISTLAVAASVLYVLVLSWAMANTTYDVWGALVVLPPTTLVAVLAVRAMFSGTLADLRRILYVGFAAKLVGTAFRYYVGFEAYDGGIDAQRYHDYAVVAATDVWAGRADFFSIFPSGTGTATTEGITALIYTLTGVSKMGGFVVFGFLGFVGGAFFVKAACIAIPGLARRRYALLTVLAPSMVYWPSSIGKDALLILLLGIATYGIARLLAEAAVLRPLVLVGLSLAAAAAIRPHMVGIWLAAAFPALLVAAVRGRDPFGARATRAIDRAILVPVIVVAAIGLVIVSLATVRYLNPGSNAGEEDPSAEDITSILDETTRRTLQAGSAFEPPSIASPLNWPYASIRTLTRPLPIEVRGAGQLIVATETLVFLGLLALAWRRVLNVPKMIVTNAYMAFAMTAMFLSGLAFTSFANLAILARQRSIVVPFMLLIVCIPEIRRRPEHDPEGIEQPEPLREVLQASAQKSSMSPRASAQLARGGSPRSLTARQVRTGPPPGKGTNDDDIWA